MGAGGGMTEKIEKEEFYTCDCGGDLFDITAMGHEKKRKICARCNHVYYFELDPIEIFYGPENKDGRDQK